MTASMLLDAGLVAGLIVVAYRAVHTPTILASIAFFIAFGLLMSLAYRSNR